MIAYKVLTSKLTSLNVTPPEWRLLYGEGFKVRPLGVSKLFAFKSRLAAFFFKQPDEVVWKCEVPDAIRLEWVAHCEDDYNAFWQGVNIPNKRPSANDTIVVSWIKLREEVKRYDNPLKKQIVFKTPENFEPRITGGFYDNFPSGH